MQKLMLCDDGELLKVAPLAETNFWGIELQSFCDPDLIRREPDAVEKHISTINKIKQKSLHGPFVDLCPGSSDSTVREVTKNCFDLALGIARKLNCSDIILHHGYVEGLIRPREWISRSTTFWQDFFQSVPDSISVHLENVDNVLDYDPDLLSEVIVSVGRSNFDVCLDVGHAHYFSNTPVLKWIEQLGHQIGYVHLNDNHGKADDHLGLGQGSMAMIEVCQALQKHAPESIWAIEVPVPLINQSIDWLKGNGFLTK